MCEDLRDVAPEGCRYEGPALPVETVFSLMVYTTLIHNTHSNFSIYIIGKNVPHYSNPSNS